MLPGEHPHYTHLLVNLPLLLGPLAPVLVITIVNWFSDCFYLHWKHKPDVSETIDKPPLPSAQL